MGAAPKNAGSMSVCGSKADTEMARPSARTLDELIAALPPDQQREIEARGAQRIEDEMTLRDLRKAHELTQTRVARSAA